MAGQRVRVRVSPGAKKETFVEDMKKGVFLASVKEPAERGEANARVRALIARHFGVPVKSVKFLTGMRSPLKTFSLPQK